MSEEDHAGHGCEPIGNLLDSLDIHHHPEEGELISGAVVLLKVITADGRISMRMAWSDGMGWIERIGMFRTAEIQEHKPEVTE